MDGVTFETAVSLASLCRERVVSALEIVEAHIARIERHNPDLNAIVTLEAEGARRRAREADVALARGESVGPLLGVPFTAKDSWETAGVRTTSSYRPLVDHVPERDATAVARLKAAGAILLAKTNLPELTRDVQSQSPLFGRTNNPWDPDRTPGGSTGGGGAAVAAGLSPLELGSDTSGSVRIPAHYNGVFALKPTEHRVSFAGHIPPRLDRPRGMRHMGTPGVLARGVDDLALWLALVEGADGRDHDVASAPREERDGGNPRSLRIAYTTAMPGVPVEAETRAAVESFAREIEAAGVRVEPAVPPGLDWEEALGLHGEVWGAECGIGLPSAVRRLAPLAAPFLGEEEVIARGIARGLRFGMPEYARTLTRRDSLIAGLEAFLVGYDAWVLPVAAGPAFSHRHSGMLRSPAPIDVDGAPVPYDTATQGLTAPLSLTGNPVVALPLARTRAGLPIGIQVVGRRWRDARLLKIAGALAAIIGPFTPPPGYGGGNPDGRPLTPEPNRLQESAIG